MICALAMMPSLGSALTTASLYPTTYATNSWTIPANAVSVNTTYATAAPGRNASIAGRWDGFNFSSVPAGSTINSVTVSSRYKLSVGTSVATLGVQPWSGGAVLGTQAVDASMPTADTTYVSVFTVSEAQLRSADFGVSVTASRGNSGVAVTFSLDAVWVVVDYTPPVAPSAPGTPTFTNVAATGLTVNWTASTTGSPTPTYTVQQSPNGTGSWTNVSACVGISALTCDVSGLTSGTTYWYQVIATNSAGSATSGNRSVTTLASTTPPSAPGTPTYSGVTASTLTAAWTGSTGTAPITYTLQWGASGSGPWTNVTSCVGLSGNTCNVTGLQANTTYYYQVVATNPYGNTPSASSGVLTAPGQPTMGAYSNVQSTTLRVNWTMSGATGGLLYTVQRGGSATGPWSDVAGCVAIAGTFCDDSGLTASTTYWYQVRAANASGSGAWAASTSVMTSSPFVGEGDNTPNSTKPSASIINPISGRVGVPFKVQARVASPGGVAIGAVTLHYNAASVAMTRNGNYGSLPDSGVYEYQFSALAAGSYTLQVEAANTNGSVYSRRVVVTVPTAGKGDGNLLVRDNASQLCNDCHAVQSHGSDSTSNRYGSWSLACRDCHTPHRTRNIGLVGESITPPARTQEQTPKAVAFRNRNGYGSAGMASPEKNGVCQVCHTQTSVYRADGTDIDPNTGLPIASGGHNPTGDCVSCHKHTKGMKASCATCHGTEGRTATVA
ncbi:MAG: fibronectin type III domain-containing protein, partial [Anaeromyxobacteraceae bacterium]